MSQSPDMMDERIQSEIKELARYLRTRGLTSEECAALGAIVSGSIIGANRAAGILDDDGAEQMLQMAFREMRTAAFAGADRRN